MRRLERVLSRGAFPREPIPHGDREVMAFVARCSVDDCDSVDHIRIASTDPRYNTEDQIGKRFKRLGWMLGKDRDDDMCPRCSGVGRSKPQEEPVKPTAEKSHPQELAKAQSAARQAQDRAEVLKPADVLARVTDAAAPPNPTREDRRAILAELHVKYNPTLGRYQGADNDASLAGGLGVPKAWVAQVREDFFGPEQNENDSKRALAIAELGKRLEIAERQMERLLEELSNIQGQLKALKAGF